MSSVAVIIVAAGAGLRAGGEMPKQYQLMGDGAVIRHTITAFQTHPGIDHIQVVIGHDHAPLYDAAVAGLKLPPATIGGASRQMSVYNGLKAMAAFKPDIVLIHDAARPFIAHETISHVIAYLDRNRGVIPALPVTDTLKRATAHVIETTIDRSHLWAAQTPQGFHYNEIIAAHEQAALASDVEFTDDASIAEWAGITTIVIPGQTENLKITTAAHLEEAKNRMYKTNLADLGDIRVGSGYDVHAFEPGNHVTLCGVDIPHHAKLKGHSDADVAMHALSDAIYGALADGDIGVHFPPSDDQWKAADSAIFLKAAVAAVTKRGGAIANCDITIICEQPKISPHSTAMRERLAALMGLDQSRISVKATTSEKLGFTGREEGIAAMASCLVRLPIGG